MSKNNEIYYEHDPEKEYKLYVALTACLLNFFKEDDYEDEEKLMYIRGAFERLYKELLGH